SGTPTTINVGQSVAFTDLSTNTPTSWSWNFGDGGTSTIQNPGHTYAAAGYYTVILTVSNSAGSNIKTRTNYITVLNSYSNLLYLKGGDPANWTVTGIPGNQHEEIAQWTSNGYNVETMNLTTTTINAALLNNYQVLRLNGEGGPRNLTDAEGSAIYSWVISGGKLLADIGWTKHIPAVTLFGIQTIEGQNGGASGLSWYFHGAPIYDGPITGPEGGVNSFASSCMDHPVLAANNNLIVDYYKSGYPMVVHNQFGYGKIVVVFANAWSHDLDWSTNAYRATIFQADNLLFLQKCILYFQISSGQEDISPFEKNEPQVYSFPNPFTNIIKLQVHLQKPAVVTILISDMSGKIINQVVANQQYSAGLNEIEYSGGLLPDGIYCFEFIIGKAKLVKKIIKRSN
ncbi:MAG: PKD domain-containing protein, partial [Bacteroidota bacterium]